MIITGPYICIIIFLSNRPRSLKMVDVFTWSSFLSTRDGSGHVTAVELMELMDILGVSSSVEEIRQMIEELDANNDEEIEFDGKR